DHVVSYDVDVDQAAVHATAGVGADEDEEVVVALAIEHGLRGDLAVGGGDGRVLREHLLDHVAVGGVGVHCSMTSVFVLKTRNLTLPFASRSCPTGSSKISWKTPALTARYNVLSGSTRARTSA